MSDKQQSNTFENCEFGIMAETIKLDKPLHLRSLTFGRLIDDIVYPYENDQPFFIDGAPINKKDILRIKIVLHTGKFNGMFDTIFSGMRTASKEHLQYYNTYVKAAFDEADDVTSQVITAYQQGILPQVGDYLTRKSELIANALKLFTASMNLLG